MLTSVKRSLAEKILKSSNLCTQLDVDKLTSILHFTPIQKNTNLKDGLISISKNVLTKNFKIPSLDHIIHSTTTTNDYLTFKLPNSHLAKCVISDIVGRASRHGEVHGEVWQVGVDGAVELVQKGRNVVVDYSSPNIAKPFHMGHLRSTVIGRFVVNVNKLFHQSVTSLNYLGDWGTQFGYLSEGFRRYGRRDEMDRDPIGHLSQINADKHPDTHHNAMNYFTLLEQGDGEMEVFWKECREASLEEYRAIYDKLGVTFDVWWSESMYAKEGRKVVEEMKERGLVKVDGDGVTYIETPANQRAVLLKSDQSTLYLTRDLASALHRLHAYKAHRLLYVVDRSQEEHFKQLAFCLEKMMTRVDGGVDGQIGEISNSREKEVAGKGGLVGHVRYGRVEGMSSRRGVGVLLEEVVQRTAEKMVERMAEKKTTKVRTVDDMNNAAEQLGVTAVSVNDLKRRRMNNYSFSWNDALNFNGDSGVFLQYSHARLHNLLAAFDDVMSKSDLSHVDFDLLAEPSATKLIQHLARYEDVLLMSYRELEACHVVQYLFTLGRLVNLAHCQLQVKNQPQDIALARLYLFQACLQIFRNGLKLLGVAPMNRI